MSEFQTLAIRMTAAYYVDALMRSGATTQDREALRALAIIGLKAIKDEGRREYVSDSGNVTGIPVIDGDAFTV